MYKDIQEKLSKLMAEYPSSEDMLLLSETEKNLRRNIEQSKLSENDMVQEIVADAVKRISDISYLLAWTKNLTDEKRRDLFNQREVHSFWLERLDGSRARKIIKQIEFNVTRKLRGEFN